jgi:hypothetical protein
MSFIFNFVYAFTAPEVIMRSVITFVLIRFDVGFVVVFCVEYAALFAGFYAFYDKALTTNGQIQ